MIYFKNLLCAEEVEVNRVPRPELIYKEADGIHIEKSFAVSKINRNIVECIFRLVPASINDLEVQGRIWGVAVATPIRF